MTNPLTALCAILIALLSGCKTDSTLIRATPVEMASGKLIVSAEVIHATDYWFDIACGTHRESVLNRFDVSYELRGEREPQLLKVVSGASHVQEVHDWKVAWPEDLQKLQIAGGEPDSRLNLAAANALSFVDKISERQDADRKHTQLICITQDHAWIIVMPIGSESRQYFQFDGKEYRRDGTVVIFGRDTPAGRAFASETFGVDSRSLPYPVGVESINGVLRMLYDQSPFGKLVFVEPMTGVMHFYPVPKSYGPRTLIWDLAAGTASIAIQGQQDGTFNFDRWNFAGGRSQSVLLNIRELFKRQGNTLLPRQ